MAAELFFLLFIFLKQLYILPSGSLGLGDFCLVIAAGILFFQALKEHRFPWPKKQDWGFWAFVVCTALVSGYHTIAEGSLEFMKFVMFWCYNGLFIWAVRELCERRPRLLEHAAWVMKGSIFLQLAVWLGGFGRYYLEVNGTRYMGTFNNPNQLAFFLFVTLLLLYLYHCRYGDKWFWLFYAITLPLLGATKSVGMFLGVMVFTAAVLVLKGKEGYDAGRISKRTVWIVLVCCVLAGAAVFWWIWPSPDFQVATGEDYTLLVRIRQKLKLLQQGGGWANVIYDRGEDKVWLYPEYLLFGAGEGGLYRYEGIHVVTEIHNCLLSVWFCYGIIPTLILLFWLKGQMKEVSRSMVPAILALAVESFFLVNYRQPFFWWVFVYAGLAAGRKGDGQ